MLTRLFEQWRRFRRTASRSEWAVRLLGLSRSAESAARPGLLLVQIDGLSRKQLQRALDAGRMPFLARLMRREGFRIHELFAGMPTTTPASQAELFYGVTSAVPAFGFRLERTGRVVHMFHPEAASEVEKVLASKGPGLLEGGSAWCDIYAGGAAEPRLCTATFGLPPAHPRTDKRALFVLSMLHAWSMARVLVLGVVELGLALYDALRGAFEGRSLKAELKCVASRVFITIVLREIATIGARVDAARGLPIIHVNFIGYDEQAHRRGPSSAFAHWSLSGIDAALARLWAGARRSGRREYELWVYSDHGQEEALPYLRLTGRRIEDSVARVVGVDPASLVELGGEGAQSRRAHWLFGLAPFLRMAPEPARDAALDATRFQLGALGPVAHLYVPAARRFELQRFAVELVREHHVPLALARLDEDRVSVYSASEVRELPRDAALVLGEGHPYLPEAVAGLVALVQHPDAGDLVLCGWRRDAKVVTFAHENGAHGGPGADELGAFALLPGDAPVEVPEGRSWLRLLDVREAARHALGRSERPWPRRPRGSRSSGDIVRLMTYNVHGCRGMDGRTSPERIARVVARHDADIACLQELDAGRPRSGGVDQAHAVARDLEMEFHFHPSIHVEEERYGNAILSDLPMRVVHAGGLPGTELPGRREPRGALWASIDVGAQQLQVITTHFGLSRRERLLQAEALVGSAWIAHPDCRAPMILCGDLNEPPRSPAWRRLGASLVDAQLSLAAHRPRSTFFGHLPLARLDHVFTSRDIEVLAIEVPRTELTLMASDHLPLIVVLRLPPAVPREV